MNTVATHPVETMLRAKAMVEAGWSYRQAALQLGVSKTTVQAWCDPDYAERQAAKNRRLHARRALAAQTKPRSDEWLLERCRQLRAAGLSFSAVAALLKLDHGEEVHPDQLRYWLPKGVWRPKRGRPRTR